MSRFASQPEVGDLYVRFSPEEVAFARAWEVHAPGLGGWTVQVDEDDEGGEILLVDPPLVYGNGFTVRPDCAGATISWEGNTAHAPSLRAAMLMICPLAAEALAAAEVLAALPSPEM